MKGLDFKETAKGRKRIAHFIRNSTPPLHLFSFSPFSRKEVSFLPVSRWMFQECFVLCFLLFLFFYFLKIRIFTAKKIIYMITVCCSICYALQWRFFRIAATAKSLQNYSLLVGKSLIISRVLFWSIAAKVFHLYNYNDKSFLFGRFSLQRLLQKVPETTHLVWKERKPQSSDHDFLCEYELSMIASVPQFKYQIERLEFRKFRVPTCLDGYHGDGWSFSFLVHAKAHLACSSVTVSASLVLVEFRKRKNVAALDAFLCFHVFFV